MSRNGGFGSAGLCLSAPTRVIPLLLPRESAFARAPGRHATRREEAEGMPTDRLLGLSGPRPQRAPPRGRTCRRFSRDRGGQARLHLLWHDTRWQGLPMRPRNATRCGAAWRDRSRLTLPFALLLLLVLALRTPSRAVMPVLSVARVALLAPPPTSRMVRVVGVADAERPTLLVALPARAAIRPLPPTPPPASAALAPNRDDVVDSSSRRVERQHVPRVAERGRTQRHRCGTRRHGGNPTPSPIRTTRAQGTGTRTSRPRKARGPRRAGSSA